MKDNKPFSGKHVLVLEGYCKQVLPFLRGFKDLGCEVSVLCASKLDCGYASRFPDHKILGTCDPHDYESSEKYIVELIQILKILVHSLFRKKAFSKIGLITKCVQGMTSISKSKIYIINIAD